MYCPNCRSQLIDGSIYCPVCGTQLAQVQQVNYQQMDYQQPVQQMNYQQPVQPQMVSNGNYVQQPAQPQMQRKPLGMKWFKFLIYFQLFMASLVSLLTGVFLFTGKIYTGASAEEVELLYMYFPNLKIFNLCMGVVYVVLCILYLITRFMLSGYRKAGPAMLIAMYVGSFLISVLLVLITLQFVGGVVYEINVTTIASIITSIIMIVCNIIYFKKRKHLFIN